MSTNIQQARLLSVRETATILGVTEKTVRRLIAADLGFPALQLHGKGSANRIPADELEAWLESDSEGRRNGGSD